MEDDNDTFEYPWTLVDPKERALDTHLFELAFNWFWGIEDDDAPPSWWIQQGKDLYKRGCFGGNPEVKGNEPEDPCEMWLFLASPGALLCRRVGLYLICKGVHRAEAAEMGVPPKEYSNDFWDEVFDYEENGVHDVVAMVYPPD